MGKAKRKGVKMWAAINGAGQIKIVAKSKRNTCSDAAWLYGDTAGTPERMWKDCQARGYRAVKVTVTEGWDND